MNKPKHLTLDSRIIIETKLNEGECFKSIGRFLNKDCTAISKKVKNHTSFEKSGAYGKSFNDCLLAFQHKCSAQMVCQECTSRKTAFAGLVANVPLLIFSMKSMLARSSLNHLMSVMAAQNATKKLLRGIMYIIMKKELKKNLVG